MKTYLVPIDFSSTSKHAAEFAINLGKQTDVTQIILLNSYYLSVYESILPTPDLIMPRDEDIEEEVGYRKNELELLKAKLQPSAGNITIKTCLERLPFLRAIHETITKEMIDVVILGSNGKDMRVESELGQNLITVSKTSPVPVIVVPPACCYKPVTSVVMACDIKSVTQSTPIESLKAILSKYDVNLMVVDTDPDTDKEKLAQGEYPLQKMLKDYHPQYFSNKQHDMLNSILNFATEHDAQLVIALPKKYSFLQSLIHQNVCQELAYQAKVPVLLLK